MLKTLLISTFFAIVLGELKHPKEAATQTQPESCGNCHDHCWANPNGDNQEQDQAYQDIHQMVSSLRSLRVSYGADATAFIFDGTENSDQVYQYQRYLAAITALTLPIGSALDECLNPLYSATYFDFLCTMSDVEYCRDKCEYANYLANSQQIFQAPQSTLLQSPFSACQLIHAIMQAQLGGCTTIPQNPMLVAFTNGPYFQLDLFVQGDNLLINFCKDNFAKPLSVVEVGQSVFTCDPVADPGVVCLPVSPNPWALFPMEFSQVRHDVSKDIYHCMMDHCCGERDCHEEEAKILYYNRPENEKGPVEKTRYSRDAMTKLVAEDVETSKRLTPTIPFPKTG